MKSIIQKYCQFFGQPENNKAAVISYTLAASLIVTIIFSTLRVYYKTNKEQFSQQQELFSWLEINQQRLKSASKLNVLNKAEHMAGQIAGHDKSPESLLTTVAESAKVRAITIQRIEQQRQQVSVSIEQGRFSDLYIWLDELNGSKNVELEKAAITYLDQDTASATLSFSKKY